MDAELVDEWTALEHAVRRQFSSPEFGGKPGLETILTFVAFPAFHDFRHISIHRIKTNEELTATRTSWDRGSDQAAFVSPIERMKYPRPMMPTIDVEPVATPHEELDKIVSHFSGVQIPISNVDYALGLDGASYELQLGSGFGWCRLRWWGRVPDEWQPIADGIEMLYGLLAAC